MTNPVLAIVAASFPSIRKDIADSAGRRQHPKTKNMHKIEILYGDYIGTKKAFLYKLKRINIFGLKLEWWEYWDSNRGIEPIIRKQVKAWQEVYRVSEDMVFDSTLKVA